VSTWKALIDNHCQVIEAADEIDSHDVFFPRLKQLTIYSCLVTEVSRRLLQSARMRFTHLELCCAHFGLKGVCEIPWNNVPELWPQSEKLTLDYPHGLT